MFKTKKSESGISTLILFIALILVAAIAAGVLTQTAFTLQSKALSTGTKAKSQVSTAIGIQSVWAEDGLTNASVDKIFLNVKLIGGSDSIKLTDTLVELILTNVSEEYTSGSNSQTVATGTTFNYNYKITGSNNKSGYIVPGDYVTFSFTAPRNITEDEDFEILISPKTGGTSKVKGSTPDIMTSTKIFLFP